MDLQSESDPQPSGKINKAAFKLFGKRKPGSPVSSIFSIRSKGEAAKGAAKAPLVRSKTHDGIMETTAEQEGSKKEESAGGNQLHTINEAAPVASPRTSFSSITSVKSLNFFTLLRRSGRTEGGRGALTEPRSGGRRRRGLKGLFSSVRWHRKDQGTREEQEENPPPTLLLASRSNSVEIVKEHMTLTPRPPPRTLDTPTPPTPEPDEELSTLDTKHAGSPVSKVADGVKEDQPEKKNKMFLLDPALAPKEMSELSLIKAMADTKEAGDKVNKLSSRTEESKVGQKGSGTPGKDMAQNVGRHQGKGGTVAAEKVCLSLGSASVLPSTPKAPAPASAPPSAYTPLKHTSVPCSASSTPSSFSTPSSATVVSPTTTFAPTPFPVLTSTSKLSPALTPNLTSAQSPTPAQTFAPSIFHTPIQAHTPIPLLAHTPSPVTASIHKPTPAPAQTASPVSAHSSTLIPAPVHTFSSAPVTATTPIPTSVPVHTPTQTHAQRPSPSTVTTPTPASVTAQTPTPTSAQRSSLSPATTLTPTSVPAHTPTPTSAQRPSPSLATSPSQRSSPAPTPTSVPEHTPTSIPAKRPSPITATTPTFSLASTSTPAERTSPTLGTTPTTILAHIPTPTLTQTSTPVPAISPLSTHLPEPVHTPVSPLTPSQVSSYVSDAAPPPNFKPETASTKPMTCLDTDDGISSQLKVVGKAVTHIEKGEKPVRKEGILSRDVVNMNGGQKLSHQDEDVSAPSQGPQHMTLSKVEGPPASPPRAQPGPRRPEKRPPPAKAQVLSKIPVSGCSRPGKQPREVPPEEGRSKDQQDIPPNHDEGYWDSPTPGLEEEGASFLARDLDSPGAMSTGEKTTPLTANESKLTPSTQASGRSLRGNSSLPRDSKIPVKQLTSHTASPGMPTPATASTPHPHTHGAKAEAPRTKIPVSKVPVRRSTGRPAPVHDNHRK